MENRDTQVTSASEVLQYPLWPGFWFASEQYNKCPSDPSGWMPASSAKSCCILHSLVPRAKPSRQERGVWHSTGEAGKPIQPLHPSTFMPLGGAPKGLDLCCHRCDLSPFTLLRATSPQSRRDRACWLALTMVGCSTLGCAACRGTPGPLMCWGLAGTG